MPDPTLALPVRHELRHGKYVVTDANGKRLADSDLYDDESRAAGVVASINAAWNDAKKTRVRKGGPAITESRLAAALGRLTEDWSPQARAASARSRATHRKTPAQSQEPLGERLLRNLSMLPVSKDMPADQKETHRQLRKKFGHNPDIHKPGLPLDASSEQGMTAVRGKRLRRVLAEAFSAR